MEIEEQELFFARKAPLRAWRLFRTRACDEGFVLYSPMIRSPDAPLWPRVGSEARCYEAHAAPAPGCRCGIYAAVEGTLDSLPGYLLDTAHDRDPWAYAEVACSGRVFVDMRGIRVEHAELLRIALPDSCWPSPQTFEAATEALRDRYGVPVGGLEDVPAWVISNRRNQGPPPDEVTLDLDLDRLDLWL